MSSTGADLENSSLQWLSRLESLEQGNVSHTNRVLQVSALEMLDDLQSSYSKAIRSGGRTNTASAQQQYARANNIAAQVGDLVGPKAEKMILDRMAKDLQAAQTLGHEAGLDLDKILKERPKILDKNAQPNIPAINNAGVRLKDFWAKENTMFRDRVRSMTQLALAEGKSWRQLSLQVRELLQLEKAQGTESARSRRVNKTTGGITKRAELIAQTELASAYVMGQMDQYRKLGYEWARWIAGGERTCGYCLARDGLVYRMEEIDGMIPAHPRCRCDVGPVDPPPGHKKGQPKENEPVTPEEAARYLDDAHWAKSRQTKLDTWKQQQNNRYNPRTQKWDTPKSGPGAKLRSNSELDQAIRDYARTPTNTQAYLQPGVPAPAPMWAPSGPVIPDPPAAAAAQVQAEKNAQAKAQAKADAEKAQKEQNKRDEELQKQQQKEADQMWPEVEKASGGSIPKGVWDNMTQADKISSYQNAKKQNASVAKATEKAAADKKSLKKQTDLAKDQADLRAVQKVAPGMSKATWQQLSPASKSFWKKKAADATAIGKPLEKMTVKELKAQAGSMGLSGYSSMTKAQLQGAIKSAAATPVPVGKPSPVPTPAKTRPPKKQKASESVANRRAGDQFTADGSLRLSGEVYTPGAVLSGSTNPQLYGSASGKQVVVKKGGAKGQNIAEQAAQQVMRAINPAQALPGSRLVNGQLVNDYVSGGMTMGAKAQKLGKTPSTLPTWAKKVRQNAATDALLANWDVVGLAADNIMIKGSSVIKIDAGGTFNFRAQGGAKKYSGIPIELVSMKASGGQLNPFFKFPSSETLADYWGAQTRQIAAAAPKLRDLIGKTKLPPAVQQAFKDRLEVFAGLSSSINGGAVGKALKSGEISWAVVDDIASTVLKRLAAMKKPLSGGELRTQTTLEMLNELSKHQTGGVGAVATPKKSPAAAAAAAVKQKEAAAKKFKSPKPDQLEGHNIHLLSANTTDAFVSKWVSGSKKGDWKGLSSGTAKDGILKIAQKNEAAYYKGREAIGPQLEGLKLNELREVATKSGITYGAVSKADDIKKLLYIGEGTGQSYSTYAPLKKKPSQVLGAAEPAPAAGQKPSGLGMNGMQIQHPSNPNGPPVMRDHARPNVMDRDDLMKAVGLDRYKKPTKAVLEKGGGQIKKTVKDGSQRTTDVQTKEQAKRRVGVDSIHAVSAWSGSAYDMMRHEQYAQAKANGWKLNAYGEDLAELGKSYADYRATLKKKVADAEKYVANTPKYDGMVIRDVGFDDMASLRSALSEYGSGRPVPSLESWATQRGSYSSSGMIRLRLVTQNKHGASMQAISQYNNEYEVLMPKGVRYQVTEGGTVRSYMEGQITVYEVQLDQLAD